MNISSQGNRTLRARLLLSACFLAAPGVAYAQDTVVTAATPRTTALNMDANDTLTVLSGGTFAVSGNQAIGFNGPRSGPGVLITNDGRIEGVASTVSNGRGISSSADYADHTTTIINRGMIIGSGDAIRFAPATATLSQAGTITIDNAGSIVSTGMFNNALVQSGQGIENTIVGTTFVVTNRAGATISGAQGILAASATATIVNSGTITGTGAFSTQGEAIRTNIVAGAATTNLSVTNEATGNITGVYGIIGTGAVNTIVNRGTISGSNAATQTASQTREAIRINTGVANQANTITLAAGSTTTAGTGTGANGVAVTFGGTPLSGTNTLNIETGAVINGTLNGTSGLAMDDTINLSGTGSQVLVSASAFDALNVNGGIWGITNAQTLRLGATIASGATLRYDDAGASGGAVAGAIVNNGTLIDARSATVNHTGAITGAGNLQITGIGTLVLAGANNYTGTTQISDGRLRTGQTANSFSAASAVTVSGAGILDLNDTTVDGGGLSTPIGRDQMIANLAGDGLVRTGQLNGATLTFGGNGASTTFSGVASQLGGFTKVGGGTLTLSGANTATGLLNIAAGNLVLPGSWAGAATLANGTSLTGIGSIGGVLTVADGASIAPGNGGVGTLTAGGLILSGGSVLNYDLGTPGAPSDLIQVNGALTLDGTINVADVGGFGEGVYRLINYTGALTDNGLAVGTIPSGSSAALFSIQTAVATQVNLVYGAPVPASVQFWDGADLVGNGAIDGGTGSWINNLPNWVDANGNGNTAWTGNFAVFQGAAGTVSVNDQIAFTGVQFVTDGYIIAGGTGALNATAALTNIRVDPGNTAVIFARIGGTGGLLKNDSGTLILSGSNSYAGTTTILGGTLRTLGGVAIPVTSAVSVSANGTLDIAANQAVGELTGTGAVLLSGGTLTTGALGGNVRFDGAITGTGGLTKAGAGTMTLGAANGYTGATTVSGGTLALDGAGTIGSGDLTVATGATLALAGRATAVGALAGGGAIQLGSNGALTSNAAVNSVFAGTLTGAGGSLTKTGTGTLTLGGAGNDFASLAIGGGRLVAGVAGALAPGTAVAVNGGVFELGADQSIASLDGTGGVSLGANRLTVAGAANSAFTGAIDGSGGLTKSGAGTLTLGGANSFTGATQVTSGTLTLDGSLAGAASVSGGATLSGAGSVAGSVTVADGVLTPGGAGAGTLTTGGLVLAGASTLNFGLGAPGATGDRIQVNGNLTLDGTLNVTNLGGFGQGVYRLIDYSGALTDNGLTIGQVPPGTTIGRTQVQTSIGSQINLVVAENLPEIQFWDGPNTAPNGVINGGSGSWNNVRQAWTNAAGDGNAEWGGRFAVFQGAAGTVTVDDAVAFSGMQFVTSGYTIAAGTGALNAVEALTNIRVDPGATATIGASIGGVGGLNKLDTGTLVLTGANSYAGETIIAGGTLRAGATGALPGGTVTVASGATLDIAAAQTVASLAGDGSVTLSGGDLTTGGANTSTRFAGVISGAGGLTKAGTGIFTLAGANTYAGATNITGGTLRLDGGTLGTGALTVAGGATADLNGSASSVAGLGGTGSILLGAGTLTVNGAAASSFGGTIAGTGGLTKAGAGNLTLTGANSYTGATNVRGGTLTLGSGALPVAALVAIDSGATLALAANTTLGTLNGAGAVALGANSLTIGAGGFAGAIGGTGGVTKTGTGTLTLSGVNGYTGATAVNGGVLALGTGGSIAASSGVTLASGGRLDIAAGGAQTVRGLNGVTGTSVVLGANRLTVDNATANSFSGVLSGTGGLTKTGVGTLTLGAASTHTGGTTVSGGTLLAGVANAFGPGPLAVQAPGSANLANFAQTVAGLSGDGAVALGTATLTINGAAATTYAGIMSGTGGLTKTGSGIQTLSGANTYTGTTNITGGTLVINGSITSPVTVAALGRLGGSGQIGGGVSVAGILAPGNSIGTVSVNGPVSFATTSTYQVEVAPNGTSDLLAATGAVTIAGGNVAVLTGGNTAFANLTTYTIITAASVTGTFTAATSDLAFLTPTLIYNPASVQLRLLRNNIGFGTIGQTPNQVAVGTALDAQTSGALFDNIVNLNATDARGAFDELSGEVYTATASVARREGHATGRAMLDRLDTASGDGKQLWIEGGLGRTDVDGRDGFADISADRTAVAGGIEIAGGGTRGGVAFRYVKNDVSLNARASDAALRTNSAFAYFGHDFGKLRFAMTGGIGWSRVSTDRRVAFGAVNDRLTSSEKGMSFVFAGEVAYLADFGGFRAGPYGGISYADTVLDGVTENGGAARLSLEESSDTTGVASYGVRGRGTLGKLQLTADLGARSYLDDDSAARTFRFTGTDAMFDVAGARLARTTGSARLDAAYTTGPIVLGLGLRGEAGRDTKAYSGRISAAYRF